jgi:hypothetical protein
MLIFGNVIKKAVGEHFPTKIDLYSYSFEGYKENLEITIFLFKICAKNVISHKEGSFY